MEVGHCYIVSNMIIQVTERTVFGTTVISLMSAADLSKVAATMARLFVVCICSLVAAPLTAPLKLVRTSP